MSRSADFIRRLLRLRVFLIINMVVLFFLSLSFGREWTRNASIEGQIDDLKEQKETMESRKLELLSLGQTIQSQFFLEQEGRLKYGLRKPGEELVVVTNTQTEQPASAEANDSGDIFADGGSIEGSGDPTPTSNPTRWWNYFFNHAEYNALKDSYGG